MTDSALDVLRAFARKAQSQAGMKDARDAFLDQWGGITGFAKECRLEWDESSPGSMSRNRMACAILQIISQVEKQEGDTDWRADMSDDELAATIRAIVDHERANESPPTDHPGLGSPDSNQDATQDQAGDVA